MIKKIRCTWHITSGVLFGKLVKNFLLLLLLIAVCLLIGVSLLIINFKSYDEMEIKKLCDMEQVGHIFLKDGFGLEKETKFYSSIKELPYVDCIGDFVNFAFQEKEPVIAQMQDSHHYTSSYDGMGLIEMTCMDRAMLRIFDLRGDYENTKQKDGIILGYRYREKFQHQSVLECDGGAIPILGFTEEGSKWLSDEVGTNSMPEISALVDTGYMCFDIVDLDEEERMTDASWFRLRDAGDYRKFTEEVEKLAEKQGISAVVVPMTKYIRMEAERNEKIFAELSHYAQGAMGVIILFLILIKLYSFWRNKRQYGVFYSSGMTGRRIIASIWMENCAIFYTALLIACIILWNSFAILARVDRGSYGALEGIVQALLRSRVFAQEFIIISLCCIVTSVIPAFVFNRIPPLSMVKSFYE